MTTTKELLKLWVMDALKASGGSASVVEVSRFIWENHEGEIRAGGDLLFTWQYDVRWAAHSLRRSGLLKSVDESPRGVWELA
jgi:hypothetical protein